MVELAEDGLSYRKVRVEKNKKRLGFLLLSILPVAVFSAYSGVTVNANAGSQVTLTVMNPRAELRGPKPIPLSPRLRSLDGQRIGLINNTKDNAALLQPELEKALKALLPKAKLQSWSISYRPFENKEKALEEAAKGSDAIILFIGD
jgi:hypothetical protein